MRWLPRTLLARIFLLTAGLVLITTTAWLAIFNFYGAEPRARQAAVLTASAVNTVRAALVAADPERRPAFFNDISRSEGIALLPADPDDRLQNLPDTRHWRLFADEVRLRLGPTTRLAYALNDVPGLWVSFRFDDDLAVSNENEEFWIVLPRERAAPEITLTWLLWGAIASLLSLGFAAYLAKRLAGPLRALAQAAGDIGRGQRPKPLPEDGLLELQQLTTTFNRMAADLATHESERAEVLAGISHDLRTPLTRLRLEAEMSIADAAARAATIADIEQMEAVITQFLDYARGDAGEPLAETDLTLLLQTLAERQRQLGRRLEIRIASMPPCLIRPKALQRAIANLLENAFRYGAEPVELVASTVNGQLVIKVLDRGSGIPADAVERLKRPFTQLDAARTDVKGTGLGLAIVERVARLHGGRLDLLPRDGGGLLARLAIPIAK